MKVSTLVSVLATAASSQNAQVYAMMSMYSPLSCNVDLATCNINTATPLSSLIAAAEASGSSDPVVVPCNTCAYVDTTSYSPTIQLPNGLDIVGRLTFPSSANIKLNTTAIFVQGILDIEEPADGNKVTINLYGTENIDFYPHEMCNGGYDPSCMMKEDVGIKPIVVAGGQLNINAVGENCPSWSKLRYKSSDTELVVDPVSKISVVQFIKTSCMRDLQH